MTASGMLAPAVLIATIMREGPHEFKCSVREFAAVNWLSKTCLRDFLNMVV